MMRTRRRRRTAALGAACAVLAGCGWGGPNIPDGYTTTEVEPLQVSHPPEWSASQEEYDEAVIGSVSHEVDGVELARIDIMPGVTTAVSPTHAVGVATQGRHGVLADYEHEVSEIAGTGAEQARRIDFGFTDAEGEVTGEPNPIEGVDVVMIGNDNWVHHVVVSWVDTELDEETAEAIVASVYLED